MHYLISLSIGLVTSASAFAQYLPLGKSFNGSAETIGTFLLICPDARAATLGESGGATSPDANSIHWNAAKLGFINKTAGASFSYAPWMRVLVPDINHFYLAGYYKINAKHTFGISARELNMGHVLFTPSVLPNRFAGDLGYSYRLSNKWALGGALRFIYFHWPSNSNLNGVAHKPGIIPALDVSTYYHSGDTANILYSFGVNVSNLGFDAYYLDTIKKMHLPINLRVGQSLSKQLGKSSLSLSLDINKLLVPSNSTLVSENGSEFNEELQEIQMSGGAEFWYQGYAAARLGYFNEHSNKGNRKFVTLGLGGRYRNIGLDLAYLIPMYFDETNTQKSPLQNTFRLSCTVEII